MQAINRTSILQKALLIVFHPIDCLDVIKREQEKFHLWPVVLLYGLTVLMNYLYIFIVHFPLSTKQAVDANVGMECAMVVVPLFSFVVGAYAMTAILSGECHFTELLTASAYTLVPYLVLTPVFGIFSNLLGYSELGMYQFFRYAALLWVVGLLFLSIKRLNDYSFWQTVGIILLALLAVVVMWAVLLLLFSLTVQLFTFFVNIFKEINFKYFMK